VNAPPVRNGTVTTSTQQTYEKKSIRNMYLLGKEISSDKKHYVLRVLISVFAVLSFALTLSDIVIIIALCKRKKEGKKYSVLEAV
jgi:hypothetical protein